MSPGVARTSADLDLGLEQVAAGHVPLLGPGVDMMALCPVAGAKTGHVPRGARARADLDLGLEQVAAGHVPLLGPGMDMMPLCPVAGAKTGHVPRRGAATRPELSPMLSHP